MKTAFWASKDAIMAPAQARQEPTKTLKKLDYLA